MNILQKTFFIAVFLIIFSSYHVLHIYASELRGDRFKGGGAYIGSNPSLSSDGKKIAFGSTRYGLGDIWVINLNGTYRIRLTDTYEYEGEPSFSPDGKKIVFISERDGNGEIYIMNSDGSRQNRLTDYNEYDANPSFSPDGKKIVFSRNVLDQKSRILFSKIFIMDSDGSDIKNITGSNAWYSGPKFSQDGKKIIFKVVWQGENGSTGIGMINTDGTDEVRIKKCFCFYPSFWSNDEKILFVADLNGNGDFGLYTMIIDTRSISRLPLPKIGIDIFNPVLVNNGSKILFFNSVDDKGGQICIMNTDGSEFRIVNDTY